MNHLSPHSGSIRRGLLTFVVAIILILAFLTDGRTWGQLRTTPKARPNDLLKSDPFDKITLVDNHDFEVEPLSPRPLPPIDPKRRSKNLADAVEEGEKAEKKRARKNDAFSKQDHDEEEEMVIIHLLEGEPRDFKVKRVNIKSVLYFEDMLLLEADRLIKEGEYTRAFERIQIVKARDPKWSGLDDRVNRLLFEEGSSALTEDNARGLRLLSDLWARQRDFPGLADQLGSSYSKRIERAFEVGDYLGARRMLRELEEVAPGHSEAKTSRGRFVAKVKALVDQAAKASATDRVDRLTEAVRIWPAYDGLESAYREAFRAEPTVIVAVADLAEPVGPFPATPASDRVARLLYLPVLASEDDQAMKGEASGQLLVGLESLELGKALKIRLRSGPTWSDASRPVTSIDVARSLADRALPASPGYNARWADLLERVEVLDESLLLVKLARSSMKPETWLLDPVGPAHASSDGWVATLGHGRRPVGDGPYYWESSPDSTTLLHSVASDAVGGSPKIKRIKEVRYANPVAAVESLFRGEISLLEYIPPDRLKDILKLPEILKVGRFVTPSVHRIALDGRNPALKSRNLRRALSLAIDRRMLLEELILRRPPDERNLVADGPFVKGSFVDSAGVEPFDYNPLLGKALVDAAKRELGGNPIKLTLEFPSSSEARAVCPKIAEAFTLIGVETQLVERTESELEAGLHAGRKFDLAYRASRPAQPLHDAGTLLVPGYDAPPAADGLASAASPRILQLLIQLDLAPETTSARTLAMQIDRESRDELPVLPLWQLDDHYAWRTNLRGPLEEAEHLYQGIANWEIEPWLEKDPS